MEYVLFVGDGNSGEWPKYRIEFDQNDDPYLFMKMVIPNIFIVGHKARIHAYKNTFIDGEADFSIHATLHEGYDGTTAYGSAYKTARLEKHKDEMYSDLNLISIKDYLDRGTYAKYKQKLRAA